MSGWQFGVVLLVGFLFGGLAGAALVWTLTQESCGDPPDLNDHWRTRP